MLSNEDEREIPGPSGTASVAPTADHFSQLMTAITASQSVVDAKLQQFRVEIRQGQEEAVSR